MIVLRLVGNGLERFAKQAERLAAGEVRKEMLRGLTDGGRKTTTQVKRALVTQTSIKKTAVDARVRGVLAAAALTYTILGMGKGVPASALKSISGGPRPGATRERLSRTAWATQLRDGQGQFTARSAPFGGEVTRDLSNLTALMWGTQHQIWRGWSDPARGYVYQRPNEPIEHVFGPSIAKEIVKGESVAAFDAGVAVVNQGIAVRVARIIG